MPEPATETTAAAETVSADRPAPIPQPDRPAAPMPEPEKSAPADALVERELLVEDVSIDGMCGVY